MPEYYDYVLGLIPVSVAGISAALLGLGLSLTVAVPLSLLAAIGLIGHAMFVNGPVEEIPPTAQTTANSRDASGFSAD
jgi:hydrogenase/urease accessory protein HupE